MKVILILLSAFLVSSCLDDTNMNYENKDNADSVWDETNWDNSNWQ